MIASRIKAEVVKANARSCQRHRQPRSAGGTADRPHQRTDPPLQDARQGPPRSPWPAAHGEPSRKLLDYLKAKDADRYTALIAKLGLRK
jgi:small subunit ribosomal protein S15